MEALAARNSPPPSFPDSTLGFRPPKLAGCRLSVCCVRLRDAESERWRAWHQGYARGRLNEHLEHQKRPQASFIGGHF